MDCTSVCPAQADDVDRCVEQLFCNSAASGTEKLELPHLTGSGVIEILESSGEAQMENACQQQQHLLDSIETPGIPEELDDFEILLFENASNYAESEPKYDVGSQPSQSGYMGSQQFQWPQPPQACYESVKFQQNEPMFNPEVKQEELGCSAVLEQCQLEYIAQPLEFEVEYSAEQQEYSPQYSAEQQEYHQQYSTEPQEYHPQYSAEQQEYHQQYSAEQQDDSDLNILELLGIDSSPGEGEENLPSCDFPESSREQSSEHSPEEVNDAANWTLRIHEFFRSSDPNSNKKPLIHQFLLYILMLKDQLPPMLTGCIRFCEADGNFVDSNFCSEFFIVENFRPVAEVWRVVKGNSSNDFVRNLKRAIKLSTQRNRDYFAEFHQMQQMQQMQQGRIFKFGHRSLHCIARLLMEMEKFNSATC